MSNITAAKNKLRQKLSLNDITVADQRTGKKTRQHTSKPESKTSTKRGAGNNNKAKGLQAARHTSIPASKPSDGEKIKATYYLSARDNQALIDIFIKRLQKKQKTDKSALISEAIQLLYKREIK